MSSFPAVSAFKVTLLDGGQRPSLFTMQLVFPESVDVGGRAGETSRFHIKMAEIPPAIMNPIIVKFGGREVKYATTRQYQPITVTIINDEQFTVRKGLQDWFDQMNDPKLNTTTRYANIAGAGVDSYASRASIVQYSKAGNISKIYTLNDLFPTNIGAIQLSWDNESAIGEYTCEFQYQDWELTTDNGLV